MNWQWDIKDTQLKIICTRKIRNMYDLISHRNKRGGSLREHSSDTTWQERSIFQWQNTYNNTLHNTERKSKETRLSKVWVSAWQSPEEQQENHETLDQDSWQSSWYRGYIHNVFSVSPRNQHSWLQHLVKTKANFHGTCNKLRYSVTLNDSVTRGPPKKKNNENHAEYRNSEIQMPQEWRFILRSAAQ